MGGLLDKINRASGDRGRQHTSDQGRVLALPRAEQYPPLNDRPYKRKGASITLREVQLQALSCIQSEQGAFLPIGVGYGKTYISLLAATVLKRKHALILAPAPTLQQLGREKAKLSQSYKLADITLQSYWHLSQQVDTEKTFLNAWLDSTGGDASQCVIVCDEAHKLKRRESARTKRVLRFVRDNPNVTVVCLSGTMTSKSLSDYAHLLVLCLRERTPLPLDWKQLEGWRQSLDVGSIPEWHHYDSLLPVIQRYDRSCTWRERFTDRRAKARAAFSTHLRGAAGVMATDKTALGVSLHIEKITDLGGHYKPIIKAALALLLEEGCSPDGETYYEDPAEIARVAKQLSLGYFYRWVWPDDGQPDLQWMHARSQWSRLCRWELRRGARDGYDSPALVEQSLRASGATKQNHHLYTALMEWDAERHKPPPPVEAVWLDDSIIKWAVARVRRTGECLWYQSKAVAAKLQQTTLNTFVAGDDAVDISPTPAAYSVAAHGTGLNLQGYDKALIIEPPSSGAKWEQLLGRLHRPGQEADEVRFTLLAHTAPLKKCLTSGIEDATYIRATTRNEQKLCIASYSKAEAKV